MYLQTLIVYALFSNDSWFRHTEIEYILMRILACKQLQKFCEHIGANEPSSIFCKEFEQRSNFASTLNRIHGTIP